MRLPFCYYAEVLPSARHRNVQSIWIREYIDVVVREVEPADFPVAISSSHLEETWIGEPAHGPVHKFGQRLYRPAVDERTGAPFDLETFEDAVSCRYDPSLLRPYDRFVDPPFRRSLYPRSGDGWIARGRNPLEDCSMADLAIVGQWKPTRRFVKSTRDAECACAHGFLSEAIVLVEGKVYVACVEPVWAVDQYGADRVRVRLEPEPTRLMPHSLFRLDRLDEAREWARLMGGDAPAPQPVEVFDPSALERDDEWAMACWVVSMFRRWSSRCDGEEETEATSDFEKFADRIRRQGGSPAREDVEELLEGLSGFLAGFDPRRDYMDDWVRSHLEAIERRWRFAAAAGRGVGSRPYLEAQDLAALMCIDSTEWD